ncbi:YHS domain-containing (seleno)protein [Methylobacterium sp. J-076]|uniref:YHS domain-containing (seleno)protein n=1 Tax=Methylobacterium sp. J-076 TaxID=2836655 RepID=UPI001FB8B3CB|nr:YHS domain-containing (seleno)protein [Methylobacterium sp. J-076]MCJ2014793.1 hypothetical protein [Methylobacterium sp. J-076]
MAALVAGLLVAAGGAARSEPPPIRIAPLALGGYDPVSYFLPAGPQAGSARLEAEWNGQVWRFAIEANRAAFRRYPGIYAPRLGGYDVAGILDHRLVGADPAVFAVIDERLYLFRDAQRRARVVADPALAGRAEAIWPTLGRLLDDPEETRRATGAR